MIRHYITKYEENGKHYAEAWIQIDAFGKCFCFWRKRIELMDYCSRAVPVKHGHWLVNMFFIECSECGESFFLKPQNYCPNCGARMDADE